MKNNGKRKIRKIKREYIGWDQDAERLVLYADIMGFKNRVLTRSHEQLKFYGIAVHHSAEKTIRSYANKLLPYSKTPIYIDKGKVGHYHLCWNLLDKKYQSNDITKICEKWLQTIEESVSGEPRMYVDRTLEILRCDSEEYKASFNEEEEDNIEA